MYEEIFALFSKAVAQTQLTKQTYRALPITLNYKRPEDCHVLILDVSREDLALDPEDFMFKFWEPAACDLSSQIFSKGKPVGFYDLYMPYGVTERFKFTFPEEGLIIRAVMAYDIVRDTYTIRIDARPEYDEEVIKRFNSRL